MILLLNNSSAEKGRVLYWLRSVGTGTVPVRFLYGDRTFVHRSHTLSLPFTVSPIQITTETINVTAIQNEYPSFSATLANRSNKNTMTDEISDVTVHLLRSLRMYAPLKERSIKRSGRSIANEWRKNEFEDESE